ncbi:hypothetical protein PPERSA_08418 [Pseudocohnilembus persalinus]|uniref:Uncharacterized protein n=1 Tax=Pseudocohnilembus persalinus TaxID=266149 RepID=A0A0V0R684_PSEPJ|nr:hypothetical protein PPERSA_08418 [Pseudocohnilembus persalinus]|eukprot:KRX10015.1 hypothetical protein PPERSA_08418 [Pseudocohnilembus persalinus]
MSQTSTEFNKNNDILSSSLILYDFNQNSKNQKCKKNDGESIYSEVVTNCKSKNNQLENSEKQQIYAEDKGSQKVFQITKSDLEKNQTDPQLQNQKNTFNGHSININKNSMEKIKRAKLHKNLSPLIVDNSSTFTNESKIQHNENLKATIDVTCQNQGSQNFCRKQQIQQIKRPKSSHQNHQYNYNITQNKEMWRKLNPRKKFLNSSMQEFEIENISQSNCENSFVDQSSHQKYQYQQNNINQDKKLTNNINHAYQNHKNTKMKNRKSYLQYNNSMQNINSESEENDTQNENWLESKFQRKNISQQEINKQNAKKYQKSKQQILQSDKKITSPQKLNKNYKGISFTSFSGNQNSQSKQKESSQQDLNNQNSNNKLGNKQQDVKSFYVLNNGKEGKKKRCSFNILNNNSSIQYKSTITFVDSENEDEQEGNDNKNLQNFSQIQKKQLQQSNDQMINEKQQLLQQNYQSKNKNFRQMIKKTSSIDIYGEPNQNNSEQSETIQLSSLFDSKNQNKKNKKLLNFELKNDCIDC